MSISLPRPLAAIVGAVALILLAEPDAVGGERIERSVEVGGLARDYIAHIPDRTRADPRPVVVAFHPALGTAEQMERSAAFHLTSRSQDVVTVYPQGYRRTWNDGQCCGPAAEDNVDDIAFYRALLDDLGSVVAIENKAYVAGWSNGARLVYRLICSAPDRVKGGAAFGATIPLDPGTCPASQPVPFFHLHGREDRQSPIEGGKAKGAWARVARRVGNPPAPIENVRYLAGSNGCDGPAEVPLLDSACLRFGGCRDGATVLYCAIPGLGHIWPGAQPGRGGRLFGPARPELAGSQAILDFFLQHR